jgi:hypothetical protein
MATNAAEHRSTRLSKKPTRYFLLHHAATRTLKVDNINQFDCLFEIQFPLVFPSLRDEVPEVVQRPVFRL